MNAKEKAQQLKISFFPMTDQGEIPFVSNLLGYQVNAMAKFYSMKCVNEILATHIFKRHSGHKTFWLEVKKELELEITL